MNIPKIQHIFDIAPDKISEYAEKCDEAYAEMILLHEEYKRQRAKRYLQLKAEGELSDKRIEYMIDTEEALNQIKDRELQAEIKSRAFRTKKDKAVYTFEAVRSSGGIIKQEMQSLHDTI